MRGRGRWGASEMEQRILEAPETATPCSCEQTESRKRVQIKKLPKKGGLFRRKPGAIAPEIPTGSSPSPAFLGFSLPFRVELGAGASASGGIVDSISVHGVAASVSGGEGGPRGAVVHPRVPRPENLQIDLRPRSDGAPGLLARPATASRARDLLAPRPFRRRFLPPHPPELRT